MNSSHCYCICARRTSFPNRQLLARHRQHCPTELAQIDGTMNILLSTSGNGRTRQPGRVVVMTVTMATATTACTTWMVMMSHRYLRKMILYLLIQSRNIGMDGKYMPIGLVLFGDKSHTDLHGVLIVEPVSFTLSMFN
jgi:hypothetical protein